MQATPTIPQETVTGNDTHASNREGKEPRRRQHVRLRRRAANSRTPSKPAPCHCVRARTRPCPRKPAHGFSRSDSRHSCHTQQRPTAHKPPVRAATDLDILDLTSDATQVVKALQVPHNSADEGGPVDGGGAARPHRRLPLHLPITGWEAPRRHPRTHADRGRDNSGEPGHRFISHCAIRKGPGRGGFGNRWALGGQHKQHTRPPCAP
jgi:hypothetical protein